jgi:hypothetical protein
MHILENRNHPIVDAVPVCTSDGLTPESLTLIIFFKISNQKDAPGLAAIPEIRIPASLISQPVRSVAWGELIKG